MICRNVQQLKVVLVILYLWSLNYLVTHTDEYSLQILKCYLVWMSVSGEFLHTWKCYIYGLSLHLLSAECSVDGLCLLIKGCLDGLTRLIYHLAYLWSILRCYILHAFENLCEFSLLTEYRHLHIVKCRYNLCALDLGKSLCLYGFQLVSHRVSPFSIYRDFNVDPILITSIYKSRNCSTTASAIPTVIRAPPYRAIRSFLFLAFTGIAPLCALSQSLHGIHTPPSRAPCFMSRAGDKCLLMHASKLAHRSRLSPCKRKSP